jgi:hypothetical protein
MALQRLSFYQIVFWSISKLEMRRILSGILIVILSGFVFVGCTHKKDTPAPVSGGNNNGGNGGGNGGGGNPPATDTSLCFERDILPIFITKCAKTDNTIGCHDAVSHQDGYVFTSYATITSKDFVPGNADETELYEAITEDEADERMPLNNPALSQAEISRIRQWINSGAPNSTNCPTNCDSNNYAFISGIRPLVNKFCVGCHNNSTLAGGYAFETYDGFKAAAQSGRLLGAIKREVGYSPMPKGGNKLSDCEIRQVEKWIADGMQNN